MMVISLGKTINFFLTHNIYYIYIYKTDEFDHINHFWIVESKKNIKLSPPSQLQDILEMDKTKEIMDRLFQTTKNSV